MKFKYIIIEDLTPPKIYIFSPWIEHREVALKNGGVEKVTGAGFIRIFLDKEEGRIKISCSGMSQSLGIGSREVDEKIIRSLLISDECETISHEHKDNLERIIEDMENSARLFKESLNKFASKLSK